MSPVQWAVTVILTVAFFLFLWAILSKPDIEEIPVVLRGSLLEPERGELLGTLEQAVNKRWLVWACVPLVLLLKGQGDHVAALEKWLERRWVDYVVLDPRDFQPVAVLQVERKKSKGTDSWQQGKDPDLTRMMEQAGLPLLWLPSEDYRDRELLSHSLEQAISGAKDYPEQLPVGD